MSAETPPSLQVIHLTPVYPALARRAHMGGAVNLSIEVLPDGRIGNVALIKAIPYWHVQRPTRLRSGDFRPIPPNRGKVRC